MVVSTPVVSQMSRLMLTALTLSSLPWSMTFKVSSGPMRDMVSWMPPVPQPRPMGSSREPKGTWYPGTAIAWSTARRISRLEPSSRKAKL